MGSFIGDALAMPVHWYYDTAALRRDYGTVDQLLAPKNPHPGSIFWRSSYKGRIDILHDKKQFWGPQGRGVHYHQGMKAGDNTLNLRLALLLLQSLAAHKTYEADDYLSSYVNFMTTPGRHNDTYVEEVHRGFFENFAKVKDPRKCAINDVHIGGLSHLVPIIVFGHLKGFPVEKVVELTLQHMHWTHFGCAELDEACKVYVQTMCSIFDGKPLGTSLQACYSGYADVKRNSQEDDFQIVGSIYSPACYIPDSFPATLTLALKYEQDFKGGLVANTMVGGDNCHRGAVLGALLGAAVGIDGIPSNWQEGLAVGTELRTSLTQMTS
jgi:ADP-ribosylglycohydrolase